ncbi:hypothetical protein [Roseisolibacter sp. H3M3-2]|uniref:hypothetical protein n=1 Tax=Roseisolibacter sp. H3M3-2 TaxID=3031323 RepID=UPI0023DCCF0A|nr:hypothetical protein [Roseisolibacter sp. H3M3-2]MDF1501323.1 hypothetical protein [Roseisolibacter sp. H3M3-2]
MMTVQSEVPHTEPVPSASQLAVLPFLAALEGYLRRSDPTVALRLTLHRRMNRGGRIYLQQLCPYVGPTERANHSGVGRIFPVNEGIIGAAFATERVWRTRHYDTVSLLRADLAKDMERTKDRRDITTLPLSWLAIPFLGQSSHTVLVLYADAHSLNFFAKSEQVAPLVAMCRGFCLLFDGLEESPFRNLRNFPFDVGEVFKGSDTLYPTIQEELNDVAPPAFTRLDSFNFEASAV